MPFYHNLNRYALVHRAVPIASNIRTPSYSTYLLSLESRRIVNSLPNGGVPTAVLNEKVVYSSEDRTISADSVCLAALS